MSNDMERFINLIYTTDVMNNLFNDNFEEYKKCIEHTQDYKKFKSIKDIRNIGNNNIDRAITEILKNEFLLQKLKSETNIDIKELQ